jgi:hypothetical protein
MELAQGFHSGQCNPRGGGFKVSSRFLGSRVIADCRLPIADWGDGDLACRAGV